MNNQEDLTPIERFWGEQLRAHPIGRCLEADELIELAEEKAPPPYASKKQEYMAHILSCSVCQDRLIELRKVELISAREWHRNLLSKIMFPRVSPGVQFGGAALAGAVVMLLLGWPGMKQRQETVRKLQEELKQASRQTQAAQVTLEKEKNAHSKTRLALASASANKNPPVDLDVTRLDPLNETRLTAGDTEQAEITLLSPRGTNVGSLRPLFIWKLGKLSSETRGKIRAYKIRVVNTKNENEIIEFYVAPPLLTDNVSKDISQEILGIPPVDKQLKPATTYKWSVYALKNSKDAVNDALASSSPHQETKFGTLTEAELGQEGRMRMQHSVMEDAEQALQADSKNPASRELLTKIRNWKKNLPASHP
jgi:hypothetical protein